MYLETIRVLYSILPVHLTQLIFLSSIIQLEYIHLILTTLNMDQLLQYYNSMLDLCNNTYDFNLFLIHCLLFVLLVHRALVFNSIIFNLIITDLFFQYELYYNYFVHNVQSSI
eukprot:418746_1